jgi:hypothetical protein
MLGKVLAVTLLAGAFGALAACGGGSETGPVDCSSVTPKKYSEIAPIIAKCTNCHASTRTGDARHGATVGYDYETADLAAMSAALGASDVDGTGAHVMPPVGQNCPASPPGPKCAVDGGGAVPTLTGQENQDFQAWACSPMP